MCSASAAVAGSAHGIRTALALCRPLGTVLLKSTVSTLQPPAAPATATTAGSEQGQQQGPAAATAAAPTWAELANDIVVNEKVLVGSRCVSACVRACVRVRRCQLSGARGLTGSDGGNVASRRCRDGKPLTLRCAVVSITTSTLMHTA